MAAAIHGLGFVHQESQLCARFAKHITAERVGGQCRAQILAVNRHGDFARRIATVAGHHDDGTFRCAGGQHLGISVRGGRRTFQDGRTRGDEVAVVLEGIVFGSIGGRTCSRVDVYQGILLPVPRAGTVIFQHGIPIGVFLASSAHILVNEVERPFARIPVERAAAAFAFGLLERHVGVAVGQFGQHGAAFPLQADALEVFLYARVLQDGFEHVHASCIHRAHNQFHFGFVFGKVRAEVVAQECGRGLCRPRAGGINLLAVSLVLVHQRRDGNVFFLVCVDEFVEVEAVGIQVIGFHDELVAEIDGIGFRAARSDGVADGVGVVLVFLHPRGRAPRRSPKRHVGIVVLREPDVGDKGLLVALDGEVFHLEVRRVVRSFVAAIPVAAIVAGTDRNTPDGEAQVAVGGEHALHHLLLHVFGQQHEGVVAHFVEASAPAFKSLFHFIGIQNDFRSPDDLVLQLGFFELPHVPLGGAEQQSFRRLCLEQGRGEQQTAAGGSE